MLTPLPRPRTVDSSVKADPPPTPCLPCGSRVLTPRPLPRTADSSVKADPPPPPCLSYGWAMGAHTPGSAPHCRQFSEGGPSPTSLPTLRVGHGCSHPGISPALQTVQWRRTLPHLPAYLAGGPWVLIPRPRPRTADSSVKADPPPPPCLSCGWAMGAHTPAWPRTADSSVKADPPPPPCLPCGWAMGAHTPASAPHCRQFTLDPQGRQGVGGGSPTSLPNLRVGHGCSHPCLGPAL